MDAPEDKPDRKQVPLAGDEQPLAYRAVRGSLWSVGSAYWVIGFGFVANILLTRLLTPAVYGDFALAVFFATLFQLRSKVALGYAFAQQPVIDGKAVGSYIVVDLLLGLASLVIGLVAAPILVGLGYAPNVAWMMVALVGVGVLGSLSSVFGVVLEKKLHFKPGSVITSVAMPLSYLPAFGLALNGFGQYSLIAQALTVVLLQEAGFWVYVWRRMQLVFALQWRFDRVLARKMVRFGATTGFGGFLVGTTSQVDNFLLGTLGGATALGYYDRAYRMAQWPSLLLNSLTGRATLLTYTALREDPLRLQKTLGMVFWVSANVALPLVLALFISAPDLVLWLYGPVWAPVAPLLRILVLAAVLRPVLDNLLTLAVALGQPRRLVETAVVQLGVLILLGIPLTVRWGASGTAVAAVVTVGVGVVVIALRLSPDLLYKPLRSFKAPVAAAVLTVVLYVLVLRLVDTNSLVLWVRVALKFWFAIGVYGLLLLVLELQGSRERVRYVYQLALGRQYLAMSKTEDTQ